MRKYLIGLFFIGLTGALWSADDVREMSTDWVAGNVFISTNAATAIRVSTANFAGRYKIRIENMDLDFDIAIGTHTGITATNSWLLTASSRPTTSVLEMNLPSGTTVYGLGESNNSRTSLDLRVIEFK